MVHLGRRERSACAERGGLVPVGVGARDEHPRVADGENVYIVAICKTTESTETPVRATQKRLEKKTFGIL